MLSQRLVRRLQTGNQAGTLIAFCGVAVTCWEIATGLMPVRGHLTPPTKEECPREVAKLIADLMRRDPHSRPSAASAYRSAHHLLIPAGHLKAAWSQLLFCLCPCIHITR